MDGAGYTAAQGRRTDRTPTRVAEGAPLSRVARQARANNCQSAINDPGLRAFTREFDPFHDFAPFTPSGTGATRRTT